MNRTQPPRALALACLQGKDTCWAVKTPIRYYLSAYGNVRQEGPCWQCAVCVCRFPPSALPTLLSCPRPQLDQPGELAMMNEIYARGPITCR